VLFGRRVEEYRREELQKLFDLYNVKWIVCWFQSSKDFIDQFPEYISKIADIDNFSVYAVKREPSFFIKGKGTVRADYNRLELNNVSAEDDEIIISYHWMKTLKLAQGSSIERVFLGGDPVGFIKIKHPPQSLLIINAY
jgi:hypothetical protein